LRLGASFVGYDIDKAMLSVARRRLKLTAAKQEFLEAAE
jgi:hypothetical protein